MIEKYQKQILFAVVAAILVVSGIFALRSYYFIPKEAKAQDELFKGEYYFQDDNYDVALSGNGGDFIGFEAIIDQYGSTKAGNLAKAYAGLSYMQKGEYEKAINHLKSFSANDMLISPAIIGAIGDAYVNMGNTKEGISYFEKAANKGSNDLIAPIYLKKAGIAYESINDYKGAVKAYQTIKDKYPNAAEGRDIEKYIDRAKSNN